MEAPEMTIPTNPTRPRRRPARTATLAAALAAALATLLTAPSAAAEPPSSRWLEVRKIDQALHEGKWKHARRGAARLAEDVLGKSWLAPDLDRMLAELAFYQAVAEANLGQDDDALWHWHMASNLDPRIKGRDLTPYGDVDLLREFPLRRRGELPSPFRGREVTPLVRSTPPRPPEMRTTPTILNNSGAVRARPGDFHVELVVDREGRLHQPVVLSDHLHPVVVYATLEWLADLPAFTPATVEGEVVDVLFTITVPYTVERW